MRIVAIICEYNPLHNGHKHHIEQARKISGADFVLCIMSGNFVQRGEAAILSAQTRAGLAISNGADVVIQLPSVFASNSAELFANGAINILSTIPDITHLSFGVENDNIEALHCLAQILVNEPKQFKLYLKQHLKEGVSYPVAMQAAVKLSYPGLSHILEKPNNLLAIEYIKALLKFNSKIETVPVKRQSNNKTQFDVVSPSATFIRENAENLDLIKDCMPANTFTVMKDKLECVPYKQILSTLILHTLHSLPANKLKQIFDITEGFENTIKKHLPLCSNLNELKQIIKSKRYSDARINRILIQTLLGITKANVNNTLANPFIKVLAISKTNKQTIMQLLSKSNAKLILQASDYNTLSQKTKQLVDLDITAQTIYNITTNQIENYFKIIEI